MLRTSEKRTEKEIEIGSVTGTGVIEIRIGTVEEVHDVHQSHQDVADHPSHLHLQSEPGVDHGHPENHDLDQDLLAKIEKHVS